MPEFQREDLRELLFRAYRIVYQVRGEMDLEDGRSLTVPLEWFPRLRDAPPEARKRWELIGRGLGIHWPDLDEDLSVAGLLGLPD